MNKSQKSILIIDDDSTIRKLISYNLKKQGFEVFEADGAENGLKQLERNVPDLVLCDIMMDGMDGFEFVEKVRKNDKFRALPFIFVSAKSSIEDKSRAANLGADDFISKPFRMEDLLIKANTLIKRSEIYKIYGAVSSFETKSQIEQTKILIVDDDVMFLKRLEYALSKLDYVVKTSNNALDGFDTAKSFQPDLILSDVLMPETDGFEFRRLLSADKELKYTPFVFLTSKSEEEDILRGYEQGIYDYVLKQNKIELIVAKIKAMIESIKRERQKIVNEFHSIADIYKGKVVPNSAPRLEGLIIEQFHKPYQNIPGGDFIDYIKLKNDKYMVVIGDVMGKRWNAWYFAFAYAGYVRSAIRFVSQASDSDNSPALILQKVNSAVYNDVQVSEIFSTLTLVLIDIHNNVVKYAGAGDLPILQKKAATNEVIQIKSDGILLGFEEIGEFKDINIKLDLYDELLMFSDGVVEAKNLEGIQFGFDRLQTLFKNYQGDKFTKVLEDRLMEFTNNYLDDDCSFIWIKRTS